MKHPDYQSYRSTKSRTAPGSRSWSLVPASAVADSRLYNEMTKPGHSFESQICTLTLAEGLAEYYERNPVLVRGDHLSPEARHFFGCHDAAHVVFGCGTSMPDEAVVKIASLFGTTEGLKVLRGYRLYESLDIYRRLPVVDTLRAVAYSAYLVPRTIYRCIRQTRRWPWRDYEAYLPVPLHALRMQFGIVVAHNGRPGPLRPSAGVG